MSKVFKLNYCFTWLERFLYEEGNVSESFDYCGYSLKSFWTPYVRFCCGRHC